MKLLTLAPDGLLIGVDDVDTAPDPLPANQLVFTDCDLAPGRYRWTGVTFVPVAADPFAPVGDAPDPQRALYFALKSIQRSGLVALSGPTLDWMEWYAATIDAQGE
jgi:hypothetical protein